MAKRSVAIVSATFSISGRSATSSAVFDVPLSVDCSSRVSFESRYGTNVLPLLSLFAVSFWMHVPSTASDLLMKCDSSTFLRSASDFLPPLAFLSPPKAPPPPLAASLASARFTFSDDIRSTQYSWPTFPLPSAVAEVVTSMMKTAWPCLRPSSLALVSRALLPFEMMSQSCCVLLASGRARPSTKTPRAWLSRSRRSCPPLSSPLRRSL